MRDKPLSRRQSDQKVNATPLANGNVHGGSLVWLKKSFNSFVWSAGVVQFSLVYASSWTGSSIFFFFFYVDFVVVSVVL